MLACLCAALTCVVARALPAQLSTTSRLSLGQYKSMRRTWCEKRTALACRLYPTTDNAVQGKVMFTPTWVDDQCKVRITASVKGLQPMKKQAIHIHTYGDLTLDNAKSLGGHFAAPGAPISMPHGFPSSAKRHWGDFGSLQIDVNGEAKYERVDSLISLPGIVGRGMVVHAGEDKGPLSQPSGGAGARVAMGVIGYANPAMDL